VKATPVEQPGKQLGMPAPCLNPIAAFGIGKVDPALIDIFQE
jgi:hypothetical protein